jgi:hypothetical protein
MLPIRFEDIAASDIQLLIDLKSVERKTLEYKECLAIANREERAEFLSDISSFANASGGDIIFGIYEERDEARRPTGLPAGIKPLQIENIATECGRIEQMIESGIRPRLPIVQVKSIEMPDAGPVIVVRVGKSWVAPHMVTFSNLSRFFSRNSSTGKVQLDVQQIGAAFALQRGLGERLRNWKADRIGKSVTGEGPVPLAGARILFHFVPAAVLTSDEPVHPRRFDPQSWGRGAKLMSLGSNVSRYNVDGFLLASDMKKDTPGSYLQVFREGALEYGDSYTLDSQGGRHIASRILEEKLASTFRNAVTLLRHLEAPSPIFVTLSLVSVRHRTMALPQNVSDWNYESYPFDRDVIVCPDVLLGQFEGGVPDVSILLPLLDSIWQAAGRERTPYLDNQGKWWFA